MENNVVKSFTSLKAVIEGEVSEAIFTELGKILSSDVDAQTKATAFAEAQAKQKQRVNEIIKGLTTYIIYKGEKYEMPSKVSSTKAAKNSAFQSRKVYQIQKGSKVSQPIVYTLAGLLSVDLSTNKTVGALGIGTSAFVSRFNNAENDSKMAGASYSGWKLVGQLASDGESIEFNDDYKEPTNEVLTMSAQEYYNK